MKITHCEGNSERFVLLCGAEDWFCSVLKGYLAVMPKGFRFIDFGDFGDKKIAFGDNFLVTPGLFLSGFPPVQLK